LIEISRATDLYQRILDGLSGIVIGKEDIKQALVLALVAGGHLLIEGPPGTAKTKLASCFARIIGGSFKRIQFTPDLMPADITGFYLYSPTGEPAFMEGPIFANIVLADELNRTTPRTQAALIEAMQEAQVTIERKTYPLASPFMVVATQVQSGTEGTYPLTEVQIDRFLLRVQSSYPSAEEEKRVLSQIDEIDEENIRAASSIEEILKVQEMAKEVYVAPSITEYIISIINCLRSDPDIQGGLSTRSSVALYKCSRVLALLEGRDYVIPDDVKYLGSPAIEHRIRVKPEAEMDEITPGIILARAFEKVPVPRLEQ
jgi:MoxR-like ATPase